MFYRITVSTNIMDLKSGFSDQAFTHFVFNSLLKIIHKISSLEYAHPIVQYIYIYTVQSFLGLDLREFYTCGTPQDGHTSVIGSMVAAEV